jgi:hypothetical protein
MQMPAAKIAGRADCALNRLTLRIIQYDWLAFKRVSVVTVPVWIWIDVRRLVTVTKTID